MCAVDPVCSHRPMVSVTLGQISNRYALEEGRTTTIFIIASLNLLNNPLTINMSESSRVADIHYGGMINSCIALNSK